MLSGGTGRFTARVAGLPRPDTTIHRMVIF
jgi:hypothetical protein